MMVPTNKWLIFYVFIFFLIINFISSGGHTDLWDGMVTFLVTESMVLKQTAQLHPKIPSIAEANNATLIYDYLDYEVGNYKTITGQYYEWISMFKPHEPVFTSRSIFLPGISVPFYFVSIFLSVNPVSLIAFSVNSLIITLTALVIFCFSLDLYGSRRTAFILGLIFTGCSYILPYNTGLFPQPLQALCIVSGVFLLYKTRHNNPSSICIYTLNLETITTKVRYLLSGLAALFFGLSIFAHPTSGLYIPAFIMCSFIYLRHSRKLILFFLLILGITLISALVLNYIRFGSLSEFGYGSSYGTFQINTDWTGLLGLLLSPGKGLVFYFPIVVLLPLALNFSFRRNLGLSFVTVYILSAAWLYFGTLEIGNQSRIWSGAIAWGPRYLIPALPLIVIVLGELLKYGRKITAKRLMRISLVLTCIAGFIANLPGTLVWNEYGMIYAWAKEKLGSDAIETMTWDPNYSPIYLHMKMLNEDYVSNIPVADYRETAWHYATYGLAPCQYDLYVLCKFGILPVAILSGATIMLAFFILRGNKIEFFVYS